jgi:hypothetical protein
MNLTDVEKAVVELSSRHPDLTKEFLRTLLEASGWEEKHIKEAGVILTARLNLSQNQREIPSPVAPLLPSLPPQSVSTSHSIPVADPIPAETENSFTFFHPDGTEEGMLTIPETVEVKRVEDKESVAHQKEDKNSLTSNDEVSEFILEKEPEPEPERVVAIEESLVVKKDIPRRNAPAVDIPDNLPLVPFESSPHIWSFGRYRDTFHRDQTEDTASVLALKKEEVIINSFPVLENSKELVYQKEAVSTPEHVTQVVNLSPKNVEIDFEKTPITKGDQSLVVLAGIMLLAIMLILGYMYSNGRL